MKSFVHTSGYYWLSACAAIFGGIIATFIFILHVYITITGYDKKINKNNNNNDNNNIYNNIMSRNRNKSLTTQSQTQTSKTLSVRTFRNSIVKVQQRLSISIQNGLSTKSSNVSKDKFAFNLANYITILCLLLYATLCWIMAFDVLVSSKWINKFTCSTYIQICAVLWTFCRILFQGLLLVRLECAYGDSIYGYKSKTLKVMFGSIILYWISMYILHYVYVDSYQIIIYNNHFMCYLNAPVLLYFFISFGDVIITVICTYLFIKPLLKVIKIQKKNHYKPNKMNKLPRVLKLEKLAFKYIFNIITGVIVCFVVILLLSILNTGEFICIEFAVNSVCIALMSRSYQKGYNICCILCITLIQNPVLGTNHKNINNNNSNNINSTIKNNNNKSNPIRKDTNDIKTMALQLPPVIPEDNDNDGDMDNDDEDSNATNGTQRNETNTFIDDIITNVDAIMKKDLERHLSVLFEEENINDHSNNDSNNYEHNRNGTVSISVFDDKQIQDKYID